MTTKRRVGVLGLLALVGASGCYYAHLAQGQARLLLARQPLEAALAGASPDQQEKLGLVVATRRFAPSLGLDVDGRYTSFAEWPGDRIVTTLVATRPGEIEPAPFRFPLLGEVPYKGFFDQERATAEATRLAERGWDTCLVPVTAYSTLGWFDDPVTAPMLRAEPGRLVETLLHELTHATVFAPSAAPFNEGVATFVGQEAMLRFYALREGETSPSYRRERERVEDERRVARLLARLRRAVAGLYAELPSGSERAERRAALSGWARRALAALPLDRLDPSRLAHELPLGDACLALLGTYEDDLPAYAARLAELGGDLSAFLAEARRAAGTQDPRASLLGPAKVQTPAGASARAP